MGKVEEREEGREVEGTVGLPRRVDLVVEAALGRVAELTCTRDLAAREAGEGIALAAAVSASKSMLSRFNPLRSRSAPVAMVLESVGAVSIPF